MLHDDYTRQMVKDHTDIVKENFRREQDEAWRQTHSGYASERDAAFTKMAAEAGRRRRRGRRSLAFLLVVFLLAVNLYVAGSTGTPVITFYSHTEHGRNDSYYKEIWSAGFTVQEYYSDWADCRKIVPWFADDSPSDALNTDLADSLAAELYRLEGSEMPEEYYYLETDYFSGLHVYEVQVEGRNVTIYGWLSDGFFSIYNKEAYEVDTRSTPVVISARLDGDTVSSSSSLTITDLIRPAADSVPSWEMMVKKEFPSYLQDATLSGQGRSDAWQTRNAAVAARFGTAVSEDVLDVDVISNTLTITRPVETYDESGTYQFDTQTIYQGQIAERQTGASEVRP